jgi:carbon monoxide dehydrogenase subunit G
MQLTGSHTLAAPIEKVWQMLMDTDILAKIVPGVSRLEKTGENEFEAISEIKLGCKRQILRRTHAIGHC